MRELIRRLWPRLAGFGACFILLVYREELYSLIGAGSMDRARPVLEYVIQTVFWLSAAVLLNRLLTLVLWEGLVARAAGGPVPRLLTDIMAAVVYLLALTVILAVVFDRSVAGIWATSGVIGIVLGLALRGIIMDVFTGIAINIEQPYRLGDWIQVHVRGVRGRMIGQVREINWRTTRLQTTSNTTIVIPNSLIGITMLTNLSMPAALSRFDQVFTLDFSVPAERAIRVITAGLRASCREDGMANGSEGPRVRVSDISDRGIDYVASYAIDTRIVTPLDARDVVLRNVLHHLNQSGLTLAYPKRDIYQTDAPPRQLDHKFLTDRTQVLSRIQLFDSLNPEELRTLASAMELRSYGVDDTVVQCGMPGDSMWLLVEGLLDVYAPSEDGHRDVLSGQLGPGQFFGEMSLLTGEPRSAMVKAASDCVAYEITKANMEELFASRPEISESISRSIAKRQLRNVEAAHQAPPEVQEEQARSLAVQIRRRITRFFSSAFSASDG